MHWGLPFSLFHSDPNLPAAKQSEPGTFSMLLPCGSQSVAPGQAASASPRNFLDMESLGSTLDLLNGKLWAEGPTPPNDSNVQERLKTSF